METNAAPVVLNFGCGLKKLVGGINVDLYAICNPDVIWDLNKTPLPWEDNSVDRIFAHHVFEHLQPDCWWDTFCDCARILKIGGILEIRTPHESSSSAGTYRDHYTIFTPHSFNGVVMFNKVKLSRGSNAWAMEDEKNAPPFSMRHYLCVPHKEYHWLLRFPKILEFLATHMRNFIWEQIFIFEKINPDREGKKDENAIA